jgi:ADP-heptose:LPS heptosyltransferase
MPKNKIAHGLKYSWLNYLSAELQLKAIKFFTRANLLRKTISFNQLIGNFRNVLIILPEKPYEVILAQKSLVALKVHHNKMRVDVVAERINQDIIKSNPYIDGGTFYSANEFYYNHPAFNELVRSIKSKSYDICFLLNKNNNPLTFCLAAQSGAPLRVGFAGENLAPFINLAVRPKKGTVYEGDLYESMLRTLGVKMSKSKLKWNISKHTEKDVEGILVEAGYQVDKPLIGLDISPSMNMKPFPADLINGLVQQLMKIENSEIIVFYSKEKEKNVIKNINHFNKNLVTISEESISFAAAFVYKCDLIISLNNLIYQLAVLLNRPVIGLFESSEYRRWAFYQENRFEFVADKKLKIININEVFEKTKKLLANRLS